MASRPHLDGPRPWSQFEARTCFLRIPRDDFPAIKQGVKREFRASGRCATQLWNVTTPWPVIGWTVSTAGLYSHCRLVLEKTWQEPLAAISPESLEREGFPSVAHFRRYWMQRTSKRFRPLTQVQVYTVRPWLPSDDTTLGLTLLRKLYREFV